jgi:hypothetical protein
VKQALRLLNVAGSGQGGGDRAVLDIRAASHHRDQALHPVRACGRCGAFQKCSMRKIQPSTG